MILVHLRASWPLVQAGDLTAEEATLSEWADLNSDRVQEHADAVLGIYEDMVVTAYDVTGWSRNLQGKVVFQGVPSQRWASLIGTPNPGKTWVRGMARPVQYLDTRLVLAETASDDLKPRRATIGGFTLALSEDGNSAVVTIPPGANVEVRPNTQALDVLREEARTAAWGLAKGGDLDSLEDGKQKLLDRLGILELAERAGIRVDLKGHGIGEIYTRAEIEALP